MPLRSIFQSTNPSTPKHTRTASSPFTEYEPMHHDIKTPLSRSRSRTLLSAPRTPLSKILTSFGGMGGESWGKRNIVKDEGEQEAEEIVRPSSASSSYSSSSEDSFQSLRTTGTSHTIPEDVTHEGPTLLPAATIYKNEGDVNDKQARMIVRMRDAEWTKEMDGHLWRTYVRYQQDPTVTPFHIPSGGVPPLGVCMRVARVAKSTWRDYHRERRTTTPASKPQRTRARTPLIRTGENGAEPKRAGVNKGDLLRKAVPGAWPVSESATRKRLRLLCRRWYGLSRNPYHDHTQDYQSLLKRRARNTFQTPEPIPDDLLFSCGLSDLPLDDPTLSRIYEHDQARFEHDALLSSTRSMELSLATSTAMSMQPDAVSANTTGESIADQDIPYDPDATEDESEITNQIGPEHGRYPLYSETAFSFKSYQSSVGLTVPPHEPCDPVSPSCLELPVCRARANSNLTSRIDPPVLSPLQIGTESSLYGTWPRRRKCAEDPVEGLVEIQAPLPGSNRIRQVLSDLFSEPMASTFETDAVTPKTSGPTGSRIRGITFSAGILGMPRSLGVRRRPRASSTTPASSVAQQLPSWAYETPEDAPDKPNLAQLLGAQPLSASFPLRLGSPFMPDNVKGKGRAESPDDGDDVQRPSTAYATMVSTGVQVNLFSDDEDEEPRRIKRVRE